MTEHDYFILNLERKQIRIKAAIKDYKKEYLSTADTTSKRKKPTRGDHLKTKLLGSK